MPALIDWTNFSRLACGSRSFFHIMEATTTSASAYPRGILVGLPGLEVGNAGAARREAGGHLVGAVGEADVELVFGWKHVEPS